MGMERWRLGSWEYRNEGDELKGGEYKEQDGEYGDGMGNMGKRNMRIE